MSKRTTLPTAEDLSDTCTLCGQLVHPRDILRLDGRSCRCPHCGGVYTYPEPRYKPHSAPPTGTT